jgi:hypothetical protein
MVTKSIMSTFACVLFVWITATSGWVMIPQHPCCRHTTHLGASNVEDMKKAWKTWQEEKLATEGAPSATDLTKDMLEMAIDFVKTGKEMEKGRTDANAKKSYEDLTEVEKQLQDTLNEIRSKSE